MAPEKQDEGALQSLGNQVADSLMQRHPLQRLESPSRGLSALLHALGLASFAASFKYLVDFPTKINEAYGWHFQYLTVIGLALATMTFFVGLLADLTLSRHVFLVKNALSFCSAPLEVLVALLYWGLRVIDKRLVVADWMILSTSVDISFHFIPAAALVMDLLFFSPPWTMGTIPAVAVSFVLAIVYWLWVEACYAQNGWYPYPLFEMLGPASRGAVFAGSAFLMTISSILLSFVYHQANGRRLAPESRPGAVVGR